MGQSMLHFCVLAYANLPHLFKTKLDLYLRDVHMKTVPLLHSCLIGKTDLIPMFINKISPQLDNINFGRILRGTFYNIQNQYSVKPIFKMAGTNLKKNSSVPLTVTISGLDTLTGLGSSTYIRDSKWEE